MTESGKGLVSRLPGWVLPVASGLVCVAGLLVVAAAVETTLRSGDVPSDAAAVISYALTLGTGLLLVVIGLVALGRPDTPTVDVKHELVTLQALLTRPEVAGSNAVDGTDPAVEPDWTTA